MLYEGDKEELVLFDDGLRRLVIKVNGPDEEFVRVMTDVDPFYEYLRVQCLGRRERRTRF
jgi:hypothetical protein